MAGCAGPAASGRARGGAAASVPEAYGWQSDECCRPRYREPRPCGPGPCAAARIRRAAGQNRQQGPHPLGPYRPVEMEARFLERWRAGAPEMPQPPTQPVDHAATIEALDDILRGVDRGHPIGDWLYKTAWSYRVAALMLSSIGKPRFTECSALLYGHPSTHYRSQGTTTVQSAEKMLAITDQMIDSRYVPEVPYDIPATEFAARLRERIGPFFIDDPVEVVLEPQLASKAAAGSKTIRIRADAMFSALDLDQLVEHEAFIHSLTMLNGKRQPPGCVARAPARRAPRAPGRPYHVRRDHHRGDGHQPPAAAGAARAAPAGGAGRGGFHRGVPCLPRRRPVRGGELPQRAADLPRRRRARARRLHQGWRLPRRIVAGDRVHQARAAREPRRHLAPAVLRARCAGRPCDFGPLPRHGPGRRAALRAAVGAAPGAGAGDAGLLHRGAIAALESFDLQRFSEYEDEVPAEASWTVAAPAP